MYRTHDPLSDPDVAVKISAEAFSERFDREIRAVTELNRPNICKLFDVERSYLAMAL